MRLVFITYMIVACAGATIVIIIGRRLEHRGRYIFNGQPKLLGRIAAGARVALEKLRFQVAGDRACKAKSDIRYIRKDKIVEEMPKSCLGNK